MLGTGGKGGSGSDIPGTVGNASYIPRSKLGLKIEIDVDVDAVVTDDVVCVEIVE